MHPLERRHPKAYALGANLGPDNVNWIADKDQILKIVDAIADDVLAGQPLEDLPYDPFTVGILGDYAARILLQMDAHFGWDVPGQSEAMEDALLGFLARRWVFFRATGRLR